MKLRTPLIKQILRTEQDMCPQRNFFFLTRSIRPKHISKAVKFVPCYNHRLIQLKGPWVITQAFVKQISQVVLSLGS